LGVHYFITPGQRIKLTSRVAQMEPQPTSTWKKSRIVQWLKDNNIEHAEAMLKNELLSIAGKYRKSPR